MSKQYGSLKAEEEKDPGLIGGYVSRISFGSLLELLLMICTVNFY